MKANKNLFRKNIVCMLLLLTAPVTGAQDLTTTIVDTGQDGFYSASGAISEPDTGDPFYGQDASFSGNQPSYTTGDGGLTVFDNNTGLTWQKGFTEEKLTYSEALEYAENMNDLEFAGYSDWRVPTIKQLYSLIDFRGTDPAVNANDSSGLTPFIDTDYFEFAFGDTSAGERIIDSQWATTTIYVDKVMGNQTAMFGVNFADGRIKGYPVGINPMGTEKTYYVRLVRGNTSYGKNDFNDNGDGTVTDQAAGLMWARDDSGFGMTWESALDWVQSLNDQDYLGYDDWRLPNAKEMQSIVDYSRSPDTTGSVPLSSSTWPDSRTTLSSGPGPPILKATG